MKRLVSLAFVFIIVLLAFSGCKDEYVGVVNNTSTTCGNIVMGQGKFAISNDFIYFSDYENFYEYDIKSGKTVSFPCPTFGAYSMYIDGEYIYFLNQGLAKITKDGKKFEQVMQLDTPAMKLYVEGSVAFFIDSIEGTFFGRNIESGEEKALLTGIMSYHIDNDQIFAVAKQNDVRTLYQASVADKDFSPIQLSFEPIAVFSTDKTLYLSQKGTFQIVAYQDGTETALPVHSTIYQVTGDKLFYLDNETFKNSCFTLKMYNLNTGDIEIVCENVYDFNILADEYVALDCGTNSDCYQVYSISQGTLNLMYEAE